MRKCKTVHMQARQGNETCFSPLNVPTVSLISSNLLCSKFICTINDCLPARKFIHETALSPHSLPNSCRSHGQNFSVSLDLKTRSWFRLFVWLGCDSSFPAHPEQNHHVLLRMAMKWICETYYQKTNRCDKCLKYWLDITDLLTSHFTLEIRSSSIR